MASNILREELPHPSPVELCHLSNILTTRFRISPPIFADVFNPMLQDLDENYSGQGNMNNQVSPISPF